jgi:hypothetical protein
LLIFSQIDDAGATGNTPAFPTKAVVLDSWRVVAAGQGDQKTYKNRPMFWKVAKTVEKQYNFKIQTKFLNSLFW